MTRLEELLKKQEESNVLCFVKFKRNINRVGFYTDNSMFICNSKSIFQKVREILNWDMPEELVYHVEIETLDFYNNYTKETYELEDTDMFSNFAHYKFIKCA